MSNTEQYSASDYADILNRLVASPPSTRRDEHYVSVLGEFRATYTEAYRAYLGMSGSSSDEAKQHRTKSI